MAASLLLQQAMQLHKAGQLSAAAALYQQIPASAPEALDAQHLLAVVLHAQGQRDAAVQILQQVLAQDPLFGAAWNNLGIVYGEADGVKAAEAFAQAAKLLPQEPDVQLNAARSALTIKNWPAVPPFLASAAAHPMAPLLRQEFLQAYCFAATELLAKLERDAALAMLDDILHIAPDFLMARWLRCFATLRPGYATPAQREASLADFMAQAQLLLKLINQLDDAAFAQAAHLPELQNALFLAYSGADVTAAQCLVGDIYEALAARLFAPAPLTMPAVRTHKKLRLCFVSEAFYAHSNWKLRRSWLTHLDRQRIEIIALHVGHKTDALTDIIKSRVDHFYHIPKNLNAALAQLQQLQPDIIIYPNIGLNMITQLLAAQRLAPVQATTWGHPITSGLSTIDYYLSSALMEPENAQSHYREKLILLPALSIVPELFHDPVMAKRAALNLPADKVLFLCVQSLAKYMPEYDALWPAIARLVPQAHFVFIQHSAEAEGYPIFKARLAAVFAATGLRADDYCQFLSQLNRADFFALNCVADVFLDSPGWSGANTTLEAIEAGMPFITLPGAFMRARHSLAIAQWLDLPETIAQNEADYVAKAAALGRDASLRQQWRQKLMAARPKLYTDAGIGAALTDFCLDAYSTWQNNAERNPTKL